jgi:cation diffusion facilitator family transporter
MRRMTRRRPFATGGVHKGSVRLIRTQQIASFSIVLGLGVLALKSGAWWLTSSAALFSDALESTVNVAAAIIALVALRFAERPADANHTYGHQKAEFFAAVIEGALIIVAAIAILQHAWHSWSDPVPLTVPWQGLALNALATLLNAVWGTVLFRAGRRSRSMTLEADGRHLWSDVVTSIAILLGLELAVWTQLPVLDSVLAAFIACYVLWSGTSLIGESVGGLMDAAPAPDVVERIRRLVSEHAEGALEAHDLRTRHAGRLTYLEFHLVVPGDLSVSAAHAICDRIETALRQDMEHLMITIHVEPEAKAKHHGILVL